MIICSGITIDMEDISVKRMINVFISILFMELGIIFYCLKNFTTHGDLTFTFVWGSLCAVLMAYNYAKYGDFYLFRPFGVMFVWFVWIILAHFSGDIYYTENVNYMILISVIQCGIVFASFLNLVKSNFLLLNLIFSIFFITLLFSNPYYFDASKNWIDTTWRTNILLIIYVLNDVYVRRFPLEIKESTYENTFMTVEKLFFQSFWILIVNKYMVLLSIIQLVILIFNLSKTTILVNTEPKKVNQTKSVGAKLTPFKKVVVHPETTINDVSTQNQNKKKSTKKDNYDWID
jgi:hypothetical protein